MTSMAIDWLNANRHRSFPVKSSEWRSLVSPGSGLDGVLLDALLFDANADMSMDGSFIVDEIEIGRESTTVSFKYAGSGFSVTLTEGEEDGEGSYECCRGSFMLGDWPVTYSLSFSSHAYLLRTAGEGCWKIGCGIIPSRVIRLSDGRGVEKISVSGSDGVSGHQEASEISGDIVLEDGYRTSPIIHRGRVLVRVGRRYGLNPCEFDYGKDGARDCSSPLFFFCGQNAINDGNIVLKGGPGISVTQGRSYSVRSGTCKGKTIPCIEIAAGSKIMEMYRP